jgi:hypothetical protein
MKGILYINVSSFFCVEVGRLSRMDFEIWEKPRNALGELIISQSEQRMQLLLLLLGTRGIKKFFDSNATDNFDRYYRNGSGGWTRGYSNCCT